MDWTFVTTNTEIRFYFLWQDLWNPFFRDSFLEDTSYVSASPYSFFTDIDYRLLYSGVLSFVFSPTQSLDI